MSTDNLHPAIAGAIAPFMTDPIVYVEPNPKSRLEELLINPPMCILTADVKSVKWLDEIRREVRKIK